jgi:hypothetical protein
VFSCDIAKEKKLMVTSWFHLVLTGNKIVRLNGTEAITLGHGMTEGVLSHPYFRTSLVVSALEKYSGFTDGKAVFEHPLIIKRDENGLISEFFSSLI